MNKSPFLDDKDFFKSHELSNTGELLIKSIPELPEKSKNQGPISSAPKPTKEITKFKNKVEGMFAELDEIMLDAAKQKGISRTKYLINKYTEFKSEFQYCLNDIMKYGASKKIDNDYTKTSIIINR